MNTAAKVASPQEREIEICAQEAAFYRAGLQKIALASKTGRFSNMARDILREGRKIRRGK